MGAIAREAEACFNNEKFFEDILAAVSYLKRILKLFEVLYYNLCVRINTRASGVRSLRFSPTFFKIYLTLLYFSHSLRSSFLPDQVRSRGHDPRRRHRRRGGFLPHEGQGHRRADVDRQHRPSRLQVQADLPDRHRLQGRPNRASASP
jgi:hypothetical protein